MAHVYADRVKEASSSTGPGTLTLAGAVPGFAAIADRIGIGNTSDFCVFDMASGEWEVFVGEVLSATQLGRGALHASSTGARISFASGLKEVFCCLPTAETMRRAEIEAALAGKVTDAPADGSTNARRHGNWVGLVQHYDVALDWGAAVLTAGQIAAGGVAVDTEIADDFARSFCFLDTNPTGPLTITLEVKRPASGWVSIGSVLVAIDGSLTFTSDTPGDPIALPAGTRVRGAGPTPADATAAGLQLLLGMTAT